MSLLMAGGLGLDDLSGPFQPLPFYDSVYLYLSVHESKVGDGVKFHDYYWRTGPIPEIALAFLYLAKPRD